MAKSGTLANARRNGRSQHATNGKGHGTSSKGTSARTSRTGPKAADTAARGQLEYAYQHLRDAIINGVYLPNQRLIEAEVTAALGVSRTTLRAALIRLHEEGLVEIEVNRGAHVRSFSLDEAIQILMVREVLEGLAAAIATRTASEGDLDALRGLVSEMQEAVNTGDVMRYSALNHRFHGLIVDAAGHDIVTRFMGSLQYPLIRYQFGSILIPGRREASLAEHRAILAALEARDATEAERAARQHVVSVRKAVLTAGGAPA